MSDYWDVRADALGWEEQLYPDDEDDESTERATTERATTE